MWPGWPKKIFHLEGSRAKLIHNTPAGNLFCRAQDLHQHSLSVGGQFKLFYSKSVPFCAGGCALGENPS